MIPVAHLAATGMQDTGWRRITDQINSLDGSPLTVTGVLDIRRIGAQVLFRISPASRLRVTGYPSVGHVAITLAPGFQMTGQTLYVTTWDSTIMSTLSTETSHIRAASAPTAPWARELTSIGPGVTDDPWPLTLPGTPV